MHFRSLTPAILTAMSLLSACGTTSAPSPDLSAFYQQPVHWGTCDVSLSISAPAVTCAVLRAPLDWAAPEKGSITFLLAKSPATDPARRLGSIFTNPGGPGPLGSSLANGFRVMMNAQVRQAMGMAVDPPATQKLVDELAARYDFIGVDLRGQAVGDRVDCGMTPVLPVIHNPITDRSPENVAAMLATGKATAEACLKNPVAPYINTDQIARDYDLARQLLNEPNLNYIGGSYGTWLGAWYARLFPHHVGRMLLDSSMDFSADYQHADDQKMGFDRLFRTVALPYLTRHDDTFSLGTSVKAIYDFYLSLDPAIKMALFSGTTDLVASMRESSSLPFVGVHLAAARGLSEVLKAHPDVKDAATASPFIASFPYSPKPEINAQIVSNAQQLSTAYFANLNLQPATQTITNSDAVNTMIRCNDTPWTQGDTYWAQEGDRSALANPVSDGDITQNPCAHWPLTPVQKPATPQNLPPILMLQSENDGNTILEGALRAWKSLPNAHLLVIRDRIDHGGNFPLGTACVDDQVARYFLTGDVPTSTYTACEGLPLPLDTQPYPAQPFTP